MARLLHLSDLHVVAPGAMASAVLDTPALLRAAIDIIVARLPALGALDAVLVTGDISDDGSAESYALARTELLRLGLPLLVLPGNHDLRDPLRAAFRDHAPLPAAGRLDWHIDLGDTRIIGLDTLVEGQGGGILTPESLRFLEDAIVTAQGRTILVALHHPPRAIGIEFMDAIGLGNAAALAPVLDRASRPVTVLAGHVHGVYVAGLGRHRLCTAPALCSAFAFDMRAEARVGFHTGPTGFALVDTDGDGLWTAMPIDLGPGPFAF